jgi:polysaccharide deacetylase 2 family uncharacterized protein YibQ
MKRLAVGLALLAVSALVIYKLSFFLAERMIYGEAEAPPNAVESTASELERLVVETLVPAVLKDATLIEDSSEERSDDMGTWNSISMSWQLPEGTDSDRVATRLMSLTAEIAPQTRVYRSTQDALVEDLRIYVGKRLTHHLRLHPTFSDRLPPAPNRPTNLALVVLGLGHNGVETRKILQRKFPMTVGIIPYTPFALRQARDAVVHHKEVLVFFDGPLKDADTLLKALLAIPNATGVALNAAPSQLPVKKLLEANLYLLDVQGEIESSALRDAANAGVNILRLDHSFSQGDTLRIRHLARVSEGLIVTAHVQDEDSLQTLLDWLEKDPPREIRPVFLSELIDYMRP